MPFLRYTLPSKDWIKEVTCKVTLLHAENDRVVPLRNMEILYKAAQGVRQTTRVPLGGSYNHCIFPLKEILEAIQKSFDS